ncbi:WGR domain-containing protein [Thiorhodococcus minor]|uniref:WGR domain-containing protein n=1 Tax=Thiorhodococcus minor TaxID=57489 RepID=A0A6M0JVW4_9GAMM|nr:WGR domain-containing protein [Thiorhodococcus minor]NEV60325.1 WGR domain-containing protein [Thiorhodococcus minor]
MQRWIHAEKDRYYLVDLVQDLLGDWTLVLCWGALGSRRGRLRVVGVASEAEGLAQIEGIARRRRQRGYRREVESASISVSTGIPSQTGHTTAQRSTGDD